MNDMSHMAMRDECDTYVKRKQRRWANGTCMYIYYDFFLHFINKTERERERECVPQHIHKKWWQHIDNSCKTVQTHLITTDKKSIIRGTDFSIIYTSYCARNYYELNMEPVSQPTSQRLLFHRHRRHRCSNWLRFFLSDCTMAKGKKIRWN